MTTFTMVILIQSCATWFMTGLIWFVQVVHYPLMSRVDAARWIDFEAAHMRRTTWVVGPVMLIEAAFVVIALGMASLGFGGPDEGAEKALLWVGAALLGVIWLSTYLLQVPMHQLLGRGFDEQAHRRLVRTNWIRCAAWSLRSLLVIPLLILN